MKTLWRRSFAVALIVLFGWPAAGHAPAWAGRGASNSTGPTPTASSAEIDGSVGGSLQAGRWTVVVPPGAFSGVGTVTLTVPDRTAIACELDIKPGSLNKFVTPVLLSFSTQGLNVDPAALTLYWYDPQTKTWVDVHGTGDSGKQTVTAPLWHFSIYKAGKAGW